MPRWEWRALGVRFGAAEEMFQPTGAPQTSDELYLLSAAEVNVKIRAGLLDVKVLR